VTTTRDPVGSPPADAEAHAGPGAAGGRRRKGRGDRNAVVPPAEFTSYYGRPVVKAAPWEHDVPAYLFLGGVAAGSSLLAAGADLTGRPALRRTGRLAALGGLVLSLAALVHDLGRPGRFHHMLRVVKPTSPMSVGTWLLTLYGPFAGLAAVGELRGRLPRRARDGRLGRLLGASARPAGLTAAALAPTIASYTAVLLSDTATPTWHGAHRHLPFVFVGSAAAASGGLAMVSVPVHEAGPARRLAVGGAVLELAVAHRMERSMGLTAEPLHTGHAGALMRASRALTLAGATGTMLAGRSGRMGAALSGAALMAGSGCLRFGVFEAGQASAKDPKYTVVPQRERLARGQAERHPDGRLPAGRS